MKTSSLFRVAGVCGVLGTFVTPLWAASSAVSASATAGHRVLMDADWRFQMSQPFVLRETARLTQWRFKLGTPAQVEFAAPGLDTSGDGWKDAETGNDPFGDKEGYAWYRVTLPEMAAPAPGQARYINFSSVDDEARVYLNGRLLRSHEGWNDPFEVLLNEAWRADGPNVLTVLVHNTGGGGGIRDTVALGYAPRTATGTSREAQASFNDQSWRRLHLPHDFVVESAFTPQADAGHGSLPTGSAWYRKTFTLPVSDQGKSVWLDFEGVFRNADVYLNGKLLAHQSDGYAPFLVDIGKAANYGKPNTLAVYVNARSSSGWWYEGGGIYRHVWLNIASPLHVAPWGVFVSSQLPEPTLVNGRMSVKPATVRVKTTLSNDAAASGQCVLVSRLVDASGKVVATATAPATVSAQGDHEFTQTLTVPTPQLWSLENPTLYSLQTVLKRGNQTVDAQTTPFGIRTVRFDAQQGLFLNGQPVKIKGTCNHQDFAGVGIAMPDTLLAWRIKKLKEMGSNAYRTSHNPVAQELLDECDRQGMLVMDETRNLGDATGAKTPSGTGYGDLTALKTMVKRDRNHPSVIMWSMANEEPLQSTPEGGLIFKAMMDATNALDGTRLVTAAMNGGIGDKGFSAYQDLQGVNYNIWAYDWYHRDHPSVPMYGSETSSAVQTRGIYADDPIRGYVSNYDKPGGSWANSTQDAWKAIATRPWVAGGFVWTGFDYRGEPTPYGWPCINSHFGILDMCGFPKDAYYYYQAWWGNKPLVHLFPHWNWAGKEGQTIDVWAYGNAAKVELLLNGKSLGTKPMPAYEHVSWPVPYQTGTLEARGYDTQNKLIASDRIQTTGAPAALRLKTDATTLRANGEDVIMVEVQIVDAQGRVVPTADNLVTFKTTGATHLAGVGNGDPSSHESDKASQRHAFNGLCMAIVQADETAGRPTEKAGHATLTASAPRLRSATLSLQIKN